MKLLFLICAVISIYSAAIAQQQRGNWNTITYTRLDGSQYVTYVKSNATFKTRPAQRTDIVLGDLPHEKIAPVRVEYTSLTGKEINFYESDNTFVGLQRQGNGSNSSTSQTEAMIYPNPAAKSFTVRFNRSGNLMVRNVFGRVVWGQALTGSVVEISTAHYAPGIYFVEIIETEGTRIVEKVVVGT